MLPSSSQASLYKLCKDGRLREAIQSLNFLLKEGRQVSIDIFTCLLKGCIRNNDLATGRQVQSLIMESNVQHNIKIGCHLIDMFASCGSMSEANQAFCGLPEQNAYAWTAIILAHMQHGHHEQAIRHYVEMQASALEPSSYTFVAVLKACTSAVALPQGKLIHADSIKQGLELHLFVGSTLVDMYAKCGSLIDALKVFDKLAVRDAVSWSAMIAGCAQHGHYLEALQYFRSMQQEGLEANKATYLSVLKACACTFDLDQGRLIHVEILKVGLELDLFIGNALVDTYSKCGSLDDACRVFDGLPLRSVVLWSAMIAGYVQHGRSQEALEIFKSMRQEGTPPDNVTYMYLLKACASIGDLYEAGLIHASVVTVGLDLDCFIGSSLVELYAKSGKLVDAQKVFRMLPWHDRVSWSVMISAFTDNGYGKESLQLFQNMKQTGTEPDQVIFISVIKSCASIVAMNQGKIIHADILKQGLHSDLYVGTALIDMYAKCGSLDDARKVFEQLPEHDNACWKIFISGFSDNGHGEEALQVFKQMQKDGIQFDNTTICCVFKACSSIGALDQGKLIHAYVTKHGLESDLMIGNALVDMYGKCGSIDSACTVFDRLRIRDVVSWSAMIAGHVEHGHCQEALQLFKMMQEEGLEPDDVTLACILKACASTVVVDHGELVHGEVMKRGLESDLYLGNALVDMYIKWGSLDTASKVFESLPVRHVVTWNAMMGGFVESGEIEKVLQLFQDMHLQGAKPDEVTFLGVLKSCSGIAALTAGRLIHVDILTQEFESHLMVENTLIYMYAKCGSLQDACKVFHMMQVRTVVSWNAIMEGYGEHGHCDLVLQCFETMQQEGIHPDGVTFVCVLSACSHAGLIQEGHHFLNSMREVFGLTPTMQHYICMVDVLGRAGCLKETESLLLRMPLQPDPIVWMALLASCARCDNAVIGKWAFDHLVQLDSGNAAGYLVMSNLYAANHLWLLIKPLSE